MNYCIMYIFVHVYYIFYMVFQCKEHVFFVLSRPTITFECRLRQTFLSTRQIFVMTYNGTLKFLEILYISLCALPYIFLFTVNTCT